MKDEDVSGMKVNTPKRHVYVILSEKDYRYNGNVYT